MRTSYKLLLAAALAWAAPVWAQAPAARDTVIEFRDAHVPPRAQNAAEVVQAMDETYPSAQRQAGTGATVSVSLVVGADGAPRDVQVVSTTDSAFVQPTLAAVSRLRFTPGQVDGVPVSVRVALPLRWEVQEPPHPAEAAAEQLRAHAGLAGPDSTGAYELSMVETLPRASNTADMVRAMVQYYPAALEGAGASGEVTVRMRVGVDGRPTTVYILRSTDRRFDDATLRVVRRVRFEPARVGGRPVPVWVELPIHWSRGM
jgi:TonB family protein